MAERGRYKQCLSNPHIPTQSDGTAFRTEWHMHFFFFPFTTQDGIVKGQRPLRRRKRISGIREQYSIPRQEVDKQTGRFLKVTAVIILLGQIILWVNDLSLYINSFPLIFTQECIKLVINKLTIPLIFYLKCIDLVGRPINYKLCNCNGCILGVLGIIQTPKFLYGF